MPSLDEYLSINKGSIIVHSVDELFAEFGRLGSLNVPGVGPREVIEMEQIIANFGL